MHTLREAASSPHSGAHTVFYVCFLSYFVGDEELGGLGPHQDLLHGFAVLDSVHRGERSVVIGGLRNESGLLLLKLAQHLGRVTGPHLKRSSISSEDAHDSIW